MPLSFRLLQTDSQNQLLRRVDLLTASVTTVAGTAGRVGTTDGVGTNAKFYYPYGLTFDSSGAGVLVVRHYTQLQVRVVHPHNVLACTVIPDCRSTRGVIKSGTSL
jgi:hypothetical protein